MTFDLVQSSLSLITLIPLIMIFSLSANSSPYGAVSLPCMTMITSFIYLYLMPVLVLATGDEGFFGIFITSLERTHLASMLYVIGAGVAFLVYWRPLTADPGRPKDHDRDISTVMLGGLWVLSLVSGAYLFANAGLLGAASENFQQYDADGGPKVAFLQQAFNMMVPLTIVTLLREKFSPRSLALLMFVLVVFLQVGFRFRIMILLAGIVTAWALSHGLRIGVLATVAGMQVAIVLVNVIGAIRQYGQGVNLDNLNNIDQSTMLGSFGGEFGIVYVLNYTAENPLPPLIYFEPWIVGIARMVPSFLWPDKPTAEYVKYFVAGTTLEGAEKAGIAAPQHVEMLFQFGWIGLPILAFLYYAVAALLVARMLKLGRDTRIAGCALVPAYFGFYMQTRGYFFQVLSDGLFFFGPLFLLNQTRGTNLDAAWAKLRSRMRGTPGGRGPAT